MSDIGRNEPCPCGSGKKYKKCCVNQDKARGMNKTLKARFSNTDKVFNTEELGLKKISGIILDLADELLELCKTRNEERRAIMVAICAWNLSLLDKSKHKKTIDVFTIAIGLDKTAKSIAAFHGLLDTLIEKKNNIYPDDHRFIVDYEISDLPNGELYLDVASIVPPDAIHSKENI